MLYECYAQFFKKNSFQATKTNITLLRPTAYIDVARRFLRHVNSKPMVESVHLHPAAGQDHVHALGGSAGRGRARQITATHADALHESVRYPDPALRQHSRVQEIPHNGSCG